MINLWYDTSYWGYSQGRESGPEKVVKNTLKALTQCQIEFAVNENKYDRNLILQYQNEKAHRIHEKLEHESCLIGPQVWPFDHYGKFLIDNPDFYKKILVPSDWVKTLFVDKFSAPPGKIGVWPVGIKIPKIETNEMEYDCLLYFKNRSKSELSKVVNLLEKNKMTSILFQYGNYNQDLFIDAIRKSRFCIVVGNTESQGIAIQEMMAHNKPLLVWDTPIWNHMGDQYTVPATTVPYWSDQCGVKFSSEDELEQAFDKLTSSLDTYSPRLFAESNLSYKCSINKLLELFNDN